MRYSRQILFSPIGESGQGKISSKHVMIIGAGALGSGIAEALVRSGIGQLTLIDRDYVEMSNLQRQQLYCERDAKEQLPKAIAAKKRLEAINSNVKIHVDVLDISSQEIMSKAKHVQLIIDATDNFDTRLMINDVAEKLSIPWIYGACVGSSGITFAIVPGQTPCFNCLWKSVPIHSAQTCDTIGVISSAVNMVVAYQMTDALKILVEDWQALSRKLIFFDLWNNVHKEIDVSQVKNKDCPSCGEAPTYPYLSYNKLMQSTVLCGRDTVQIRRPETYSFNLTELEEKFSKQELVVQRNPYLLTIDFNPQKMVIFKDGRVLIHGTQDISEAKRLYYKFLG
ncbi:thiazole biosynthesis adenylyltransferase ThiF [Pullulanibacillus camelliae]|uniref:Thiazole biosynthesis adenylyltransferase ThiF n=1 Tax=Pullulanibacillus camelliae TaxID=1707096 RepID=A0A8J2YKR2_9BACL|nr:ThiF family adenylyltransferase [Pullulanibacillus camelliae]GGE50456.1 thiazole biosynthesis adenylyltransferase ThiF [Pullulanibacillus camelliae]